MTDYYSARTILNAVRDARGWRPAAFAALSRGVLYRNRNAHLNITDHEHLVAAAEWLGRAQDSQSDGGVSGRYHLGEAWTSSYPETTGYIIPTFLALEGDVGLAGYTERARRCVEFLLSVQLPDGAFPGMEIAENRDQPSIFNSAQILNGLTAWHGATGDETVLRSATRVADWLISQQDADGAWRRHLYGSGKTYTYMAHAGCWIAEFGAHTGESRYLDAARRHLEWVLTHVEASTGWIADCGFEEDRGTNDAVTHTIAYTIWGVLMMSHILRHEEGFTAARRAARAVARRLGVSKWLPGRLDSNWKGTAPYACLTGNAQMALIWMEIHRIDSDPSLVNAACSAIDLVKRAQIMESTDPGLRGGIGGSDPLWGNYIRLAVPNWAAKFFIDALLAKRRVLGEISVPITTPETVSEAPLGVPLSLPRSRPPRDATDSKPIRVILLSDEHGAKVDQYTTAWASLGIRPDGVVIRRRRDESVLERLRVYARDYGVANLARRVIGRRTRSPVAPVSPGGPAPAPASPAHSSVAAFCSAKAIPFVEVDSIDGPADVERIRSMNGDLFVYAGFGILRKNILNLARLGTLNVHMGLLPPMRGMNVAEWSAFIGMPTGCTVHLIDAGIDTGPILLFQPAEIGPAATIQALRDQLDAAQIETLGRVVQWILENGELPPAYEQQADEGRQYFVMHDELRGLLQSYLRRHSAVAVP